MSRPERQASSDLMTITWPRIHGAGCQRRGRSLQRRIGQAVQTGVGRQVKRLSYLLVHSLAARALAVKRVTANPGRPPPGVDGDLWDTPERQAQAIERSGRWQRYRPLPLKQR